MISQRARGLFHILLLGQALLAGLALMFGVAVASHFFAVASILRLDFYPVYWGILALGLVIESLNRDGQKISSDLFQRSFLHQHGVSLRQTIFAAGALLLYLAIVKDAYISRTVLLITLPTLYLMLFWSNFYMPTRLARRMFTGKYEERALLIGPASKATELEGWLQNKKVFGLRVLGILTDDQETVIGVPRLGTLSELERTIDKYKITQAILLELPDDSRSHQSLVGVLENCGVRLLIFSNLEDKLRHPAIHFQDEGMSFVAPREERLENPLNRLLKRLLDVAVALPVIIFVLPPLCVVTWLLHRMQSRGPLFFWQVRAGIQNREFQIVKFRTMHVQMADDVQHGSPADDRVFPSGRWLRQLRIDEIPQFLNVLWGEMSVVGPRPHLVEHNTQFSKLMARYHIRTIVKPGITGLAQVRGFRGDVQSADDIRHRLESDIYYLENWRLAFDISIIFRTALQMALMAANSMLMLDRRPSASKSKLVIADEDSAEPAEVTESETYVSGSRKRANRQILGIKFFTGSAEEAVAIGMEGGLVVAPSAPVLLGLEGDSVHRAAVLGSSVAITDSGLMVLLWELMTGDRITRVSGLAYLKLLLEQPELRKAGSVFWVMPNLASMEKNLAWLRGQGFPVTAEDCYIAPLYAREDGEISDPVLLEMVSAKRPKHIIMAVGGGVQEKLGASLQKSLTYQPAIHCTGAAIGFLSGDQIRIPMWADRLRMGWLCRCVGEPAKFIPRYWEARKLVNLMFEYHGRLPGGKATSISHGTRETPR